MSRLLPRIGALGLLTLGLLGCSSEPATIAVSGQLLDKGQPLKIATQGLPPGDKGIWVGFVALGKDGQPGENSYATVAPADATFTVPGKGGKGLLPGKYRITVARGAMGKKNPADAAFGATNSPLQVEIPASGAAKIKVDVGTKQATVE